MTTAGGPGMLSLRLATQDAHHRTDSDIGRGNWLDSPSAYAAFLDRTLRFHRIVEQAVAPVALRIEGLEYEQRRRSPLLELDLAALARVGVLPGFEPEESPPAPLLLIDGPGEALGCLYVVEGATLGGRVLSRWIEGRLGYDRDSGASSFAAYQDATVSRWQSFAALVEARLASVPKDRVLMCAVAQRTFAIHHAVVVQACLAAEAIPG
jgi:heme oxygenase